LSEEPRGTSVGTAGTSSSGVDYHPTLLSIVTPRSKPQAMSWAGGDSEAVEGSEEQPMNDELIPRVFDSNTRPSEQSMYARGVVTESAEQVFLMPPVPRVLPTVLPSKPERIELISKGHPYKPKPTALVTRPTPKKTRKFSSKRRVLSSCQ